MKRWFGFEYRGPPLVHRSVTVFLALYTLSLCFFHQVRVKSEILRIVRVMEAK